MLSLANQFWDVVALEICAFWSIKAQQWKAASVSEGRDDRWQAGITVTELSISIIKQLQDQQYHRSVGVKEHTSSKVTALNTNQWQKSLSVSASMG